MGMTGGFPGRRLVVLAGSGDQRYKADVTWISETALESPSESVATNRCKPNLATERLVIRTCYPETRLSARFRLGCVPAPTVSRVLHRSF
jgi:hypothetical protein